MMNHILKSNIFIFLQITLMIVVCGNYTAHAQKITIADEKFNQHKAAGDKYYKDEEYYLAAQEYLKATKIKSNDPYVDYQLAECYRKNLDYDDAEKWYEKVLNLHSDKFPLTNLWLGLMYKTNGKYIEAEKTLDAFMKSFKPKTKEDNIRMEEAKFEYKGCLYALEEMKKPARNINFKLLPPPVNSKNTDFAPVLFFHDSSIVITSARADSKGSEMNLATGEARTDNFRFEKKGDRWERMHNNDGFDIVNTSADDGAGELTRDKTKYYYTICDPECNIYVSKKNEAGKFTKPVKLNKNINAVGYWNAQPTLSPTADTMFFVSKRPGGEGGNDIWMSVNKDKTGKTEEWGPPLNMVAINTPYNDMTPFWDDHTNTIYFASDGHVGFGGLDIYMAHGAKRDSIINLGMPFNSSRDDFYFNLGKEKGYLVSNRKGGIGLNDIYWFDIKEKEAIVGEIPKETFVDAESVTSIGQMIYNDTQQPVANVLVALKDDQGNVLKEARTNSNGEFRFENLPPDKNFKITMSSNDPRIEAKVNYQVEKKKIPVANGISTATPTNKPAPEKEPYEPTKTDNIQKASVATPKTNSYTVVDKPEENLLPELAVNVSPVQEKKSAVNGSKSAITVSSFQVKGSNRKPTSAFFENVYFDFNSVELTPAAKKAMADLLNFYGNNKEIQIEIRAYTDGYGDPAYNKQLAELRGQACYDYLVSHGVDQTALLIMPLGATKPVGSNNSYIGRQLNRRVEFRIINAKEKFEPTAMAYVVEPHMTLWSVSKKFSMSVDELKQLNGITDNYIQAYSVIRVKRNPNSSNIAAETINSLQEGVQEYKFKDMQFIPVGNAGTASNNNTSFTESGDEYYIVQPKETLFSIAKKNGLTVEQLMELNGLIDNNISVGQKLKVKI